MFIRSQDKKLLVKTDCIYINDNLNVQCLKGEELIYLGTYDSEERALEVLDMIQDSIEDGMSCYEKSVIDLNGTTQSWKRNIIFEMPKI